MPARDRDKPAPLRPASALGKEEEPTPVQDEAQREAAPAGVQAAGLGVEQALHQTLSGDSVLSGDMLTVSGDLYHYWSREEATSI